MAENKYQFPPSSPLTSGEGIEEQLENDPFSLKNTSMKGRAGEADQRGRADYPTPNPSSSMGRSSSPARINDYQTERPKKQVSFNLKAASPKRNRKVRINRDFNILDPDANVLRVPLVESKDGLLIGRSSKSCDFYLSAKDKTISRVHMSVSYNPTQISISCLGYNGLAIKVPTSCLVYATDVKNNYMVLENNGSILLNANDLSKLNIQPRSIKLDANQTEFTVNRNETIILPRLNNILLEIRNNIILLNPVECEEELTDEEVPVLIKKYKVNNDDKGVGQHHDNVTAPTNLPIPSKVLMPKIPLKDNSTSEIESLTPTKTPVKKQLDLDEIGKQELEVEMTTDIGRNESEIAEPINIINQPKPQSVIKSTINSNSFKIHQDANASDPSSVIRRPSTPLADKSNVYSNPNTPIVKVETLTKRKAQSEEPSKIEPETSLKRSTDEISLSKKESIKRSKKKHESSERSKRVETDQSCIANITNIPEINNILINHLAFSRLSSTPASFLNTISAITSKLSLKQIRVILHNIRCIGVIYRQGKDAAGKPLEEEYYYIPEKDDDLDRTNLVESIKGHGGLRSCRRTHKQYYWKKPAPIKK